MFFSCFFAFFLGGGRKTILHFLQSYPIKKRGGGVENNSESGGIMQIREIGGMDRGRNFLRPDPLKKMFFSCFFLGGGAENHSAFPPILSN